MEDYKIYRYIDECGDAYKEDIELVNGLTFSQRDTIRTIEFYSNSQYLSGNKDGLGREKPFYNICNYRVTVAKTATDLDVKDIKFEPDSLKYAVPTMIYNRELFKYLKEINFSQTLNEYGHTRPKYGGVLVKKTKDGIEIAEWKNIENDPVDVLGGAIVETHYLQPSEVAEKLDSWYNVQDFMKAHTRAHKNKPARMIVKEITGEFPVSFDPDEEDTEENQMRFKTMCFYVGIVNKKKFYLYKEDLKDIRDKYRYSPWEKIPGRGLGRGIVEDGTEAQVWTNDAVIAAKNATDLTTKVVLITDSQKISGNAITGVDSGHIFQVTKGDTMTAVNLGPSKLPEIQNLVELWKQQYDASASTYDANTGEAPTAGTPYSQTALLNQVANSPFEFRREESGIFWNEILNDWMFLELKKRIKKAHYLVSEFDADELKMIDEDIRTFNQNRMKLDKVLEGQVPTIEDEMGMNMAVDKALTTLGSKREIEIPEGYLDIEGKITANITGELKNKSAILQSLDSILKTVVASFNPNTGQYAVLQDPVLSKIFAQIVESAGVPFSSAQLKNTGGGVPSPDLSAISPINGAQPVGQI